MHVLLGPATVALAVPIMRHRAVIRARGRAIGVALLCGALTGILTAVGLGAALGLPADILLSKGVRAVIVTLGKAGALLHTREVSEHVPAFDCGRVVETAGAGDGFAGGLAAALSRGDSPLDAVRFGCALASLSVTRAGTAPSMPTLDEINAVLGAHAALAAQS